MMTKGKRIYVLDTNVLMHDPTALFKFEEHDVFLPMQVIEELDNAKKGTSEASRNARQVSRFINELIETHGSFSHSKYLSEVLNQVYSPKIGILWDLSHPMRVRGSLHHSPTGVLKHEQADTPRLHRRQSTPTPNLHSALAF